MGSPPLTRGQLRGIDMRYDDVRITPAHAGTTEYQPYREDRGEDHPRSRGDNDNTYSDVVNGVGSPPLTRGQLFIKGIYQCHFGITPAHAGTTLNS